MSFEDELNRSLTESRQRAADNDAAAQERIALALQAIDGLHAKLQEAAAFLASHRVPTEPFTADRVRHGFWGAKRLKDKLADGWKLTEWLALSTNGEPWQISQNASDKLFSCEPWDLEGMRSSIRSGEAGKLPLGGLVLRMPYVVTNNGLREDHPLKVEQPHSDLPAIDVQALLAHKVVELARTYGR